MEDKTSWNLALCSAGFRAGGGGEGGRGGGGRREGGY